MNKNSTSLDNQGLSIFRAKILTAGNIYTIFGVWQHYKLAIPLRRSVLFFGCKKVV